MSGVRFEQLGAQLRQDLAGHEDKAAEARVRRELLARHVVVPQRSTWQARLVPAVAACAALAAVAALALFVWSWRGTTQTPLRFWIEDRTGQLDEWVTARDAEQSLRFSDGSSVVASPHTTTRVVATTAEGARLTLERGQLDAHVVHRDASRWQVAAGPFAVRVTGTRFRMTWDPLGETLAVAVSEGRVVVSGGGHPEHELAAGSSLQLHVAGGVELKSAFEGAQASASAEPGPEAAPAANARDEDELIAGRKGAEHKADWRELSTNGRYREALSSVEQLGFAAQCEALSARDLLTLGSTARLGGRADRAREAYLAVRRRFPTSSEAAISAFSLGRLASDAGQPGDAVGWFKRYLAEQPGGQLGREASGRLIELYRQTGGEAQARTLAESYLKQYPGGPHAALARSVLARP